VPLFVLERKDGGPLPLQPARRSDALVADSFPDAVRMFHTLLGLPDPGEAYYEDVLEDGGYEVHGVSDCDGTCADHREWLDAIAADDAVDRARGE
jgi:hypothetical protein